MAGNSDEAGAAPLRAKSDDARAIAPAARLFVVDADSRARDETVRALQDAGLTVSAIAAHADDIADMVEGTRFNSNAAANPANHDADNNARGKTTGEDDTFATPLRGSPPPTPPPILIVLDPDPPPGQIADGGVGGGGDHDEEGGAGTIPDLSRIPSVYWLLYTAGRRPERMRAWLARGVTDYVAKAIPPADGGNETSSARIAEAAIGGGIGGDGLRRVDELVRVARRLLRRINEPGRTERPTEWIATERHAPGWVELTAPSTPEYLSRLRGFALALAAREWPDDLRTDLLAAAEEAASNAMEWGNRLDPDKRVHLSFALFDDRVVFKCVDEGEGFRPGEVPDPWRAPDAARDWRATRRKRPGGQGLPLLYAAMDEVVFSERGNVVLMTKWLPRRSGG